MNKTEIGRRRRGENGGEGTKERTERTEGGVGECRRSPKIHPHQGEDPIRTRQDSPSAGGRWPSSARSRHKRPRFAPCKRTGGRVQVTSTPRLHTCPRRKNLRLSRRSKSKRKGKGMGGTDEDQARSVARATARQSRACATGLRVQQAQAHLTRAHAASSLLEFQTLETRTGSKEAGSKFAQRTFFRCAVKEHPERRIVRMGKGRGR
jgi:hypothetical protein